jgi:DNA-binding transcriptional MerR regulator
MTENIELPDGQEFFKLNEVCKLANVQPYMLRFWGTEFEQLETTKTETGQRLYTRPQMQLILEVRRLLFDEGLTIAGARKQVESLMESGKLDLTAEPPPEPPREKKAKPKPKPKAKPKATPKAAKPKPAKKAAPAKEKEPPAEVDKEPRVDVQPLLAALEEVRKEVSSIVDELKAEN